jgi:hypothetical protein
MNKKNLFSLSLICVTLLTHSNLLFASADREVSQSKLNELTSCIITEVTYINGDYEPEMILTLDNQLRLLSKCFYGIYFAGQRVQICFNEDQSQLILMTEHTDGGPTFYRVSDHSHFYRAL